MIQEIKQSLRTMMNGPVSQSMRAKGAAYKFNFGVELPRLQAYAEELRQSDTNLRELALQLRADNVRECRLLAAMLMPAQDVDEQLAELWADEIVAQEEGECAVMHLFQHVPCASALAFKWISDECATRRMLGWNLMSRLYARGLRPTERDREEILDQLRVEIATAQRETATPEEKAAGLAAYRCQNRMEEE